MFDYIDKVGYPSKMLDGWFYGLNKQSLYSIKNFHHMLNLLSGEEHYEFSITDCHHSQLLILLLI